ncbi:site-2 protease family protein [Candidatus Saccharibacteria bacterium]|nr:site-2 protease family protein [Candidatus Saccharibacteria bacterium]
MNIGAVIAVFIIILFSMVLHELAHGVVAYLLGDSTAKDEGRLSLNPFKHLDPFISVILPLGLYLMGGPIFGGAKPVPINTRTLKWVAAGMALVAVAGPLTNFLLAFIRFLIGHFTGMLYQFDLTGLIFREMVYANLGFMIFNLIPIPPLDGSRVLYAIAPDGVRRFMEQMEGGLGLGVVLVLVLIFGTALSKLMTGAMNGILQFFEMIVGMK